MAANNEAVMTENRGRPWSPGPACRWTGAPAVPAERSTINGCTSTAHEQTSAYFEGIWRGADTALLGRTNYEGFYSVWPGITRDPGMPARVRELGAWIDAVDKVVFSRTLTEADLVDDLRMAIVPSVVGGGLRMLRCARRPSSPT